MTSFPTSAKDTGGQPARVTRRGRPGGAAGQDGLRSALPLMLPTFCNNAIELLKGTAVVSLISLTDMTFQAQVVRAQTGSTLVPFATILVLYFLMALAISHGMRWLERRTAVPGLIGAAGKGR